MSVDFIDSNVFIYLFDDVDSAKRLAAERIVQDALARGNAVISFQVVQETLNVLTRKLGASTHDARSFLEAVLGPLWSVPPSAALYQAALDTSSRYRYSFYDSLIIAAARSTGSERLFSEDLQAGQKIGTLEIVNPFLPRDQ